MCEALPTANAAVAEDTSKQERRDTSGQRVKQSNDALSIHHHGRFHRFNARQCAVCGNPLTIHEQTTGDTCRDVQCTNQHLRTTLQLQNDQQSARHEKALACRESVAQSQSTQNAESLGLGILPSNDRRLTNLPAKRIRTFRDLLMQRIGQATAIQFAHDAPPETIDQSPPSPQLPANQLAVLGNACATCGGDCCSQGGDHALIQAETIRSHIERHPEQRPRDILALYLSHLGGKTYEGSCVFHGSDGCNLPREMRSHLCNAFFCKGLSEFLFQLPESRTSPSFVVAMVDQEITRSALIDDHQRHLYDASGQTLDCASENDPSADGNPIPYGDACHKPRKE